MNLLAKLKDRSSANPPEQSPDGPLKRETDPTSSGRSSEGFGRPAVRARSARLSEHANLSGHPACPERALSGRHLELRASPRLENENTPPACASPRSRPERNPHPNPGASLRASLPAPTDKTRCASRTVDNWSGCGQLLMSNCSLSVLAATLVIGGRRPPSKQRRRLSRRHRRRHRRHRRTVCPAS